jgi:rod shape determining protein RodA
MILALENLGPRLRVFARRWLRPPQVDWPLALALVLLAGVGLVNLYSAGGPDTKVALNQGARVAAEPAQMDALAVRRQRVPAARRRRAR